MRILRTSFVLFPLLLSACSLPTTSTPSSVPVSEPVSVDTQIEEPAAPHDATPEKQTSDVKESEHINKATDEELLTQYKNLQLLAQQNIEELEQRLGRTISPKELSVPSINDSALLASKVEELKSYTSDLTSQIVALDKRVNQRREHPSKGDVLQLHLSSVEVTKDRAFKAPSLVGNWVRGESRIIKLTENFLVENAMSEPLSITFTESYQIIINQKLIGTFAPTRNKYELEFDAPTSDNSGQVTGTLKIRLEG